MIMKLKGEHAARRGRAGKELVLRHTGRTERTCFDVKRPLQNVRKALDASWIRPAFEVFSAHEFRIVWIPEANA